MSTSIPVSASLPFLPPAGLALIAPEPRSRLGDSFGNVLKAAASSLVESGSGILGVGSEYSGLLQMQIEAQRELQLVSMISNVEKSKHETQMAAIRNIRVG